MEFEYESYIHELEIEKSMIYIFALSKKRTII